MYSYKPQLKEWFLIFRITVISISTFACIYITQVVVMIEINDVIVIIENEGGEYIECTILQICYKTIL